MIIKLTLRASIKKITSGWLKPLLFVVLFIAGNQVSAQAPNISYQTPLTYTVNTAITPLTPKNTGGAVPGRAYGQVTTLAGNGTTGAADGQGSAAEFSSPRALATDAAGNIYVADNGNNNIRKITPQGLVSTFAGSGIAGNANGSGKGASFTNPSGVWVDANGNVYVADSGNQLIRKITPNGMVSTIAGNGQPGANDGTTFANFNFPNDVVGDNAGNIYVSDYVNDEIRKVAPDGTVSTFAGYPVLGNTDGKGNTARFYNPGGITIDAAGNLYVADDSNDEIREITPAGVVTTLAGNGTKGSADAKGALATFSYPTGVTIDQAGNLYVSDTFNSTIRKIDPSGNVTTFAGVTGVYSFTNGDRLAATFNDPYGVTVDGFGNLFVSDEGNAAIREINLTGYSIDKQLPAGLTFDATTGTISGTPTATSPATDYTITAYNLSGSSSAVVNISVKAANPPQVGAPNISYQTPQVYTANNAIASLAPVNTGGAVPANAYGQTTIYAGANSQGYADGPRANAEFNGPEGMAIDAAGDIYVADNVNNAIREISATGLVTTIDKCSRPGGVAVDNAGNVYVADYTVVLKILPSGVVDTLAGSNSGVGYKDATGSAARFNNAYGIIVDGAGNVYVADLYNYRIRKITPAGVVTTLAGDGSRNETDGQGTAASFFAPEGLALDAAGNIYVADLIKIRKITPGGLVSTVAGNGSQQSTDGPVASASFNGATQLTITPNGDIYVSDQGAYSQISPGNRIRKISNGAVSTLIINATYASNTTYVDSPSGIVTDGNGNLFVASTTFNWIQQIGLTGYTIDKPLPAGLVFDPTTGIISGTPTVASPATNYTITAYNAGGSSMAVVNITVKAANIPLPAPPNISYQTPQVYTSNTAIVPLAPTNTGGAVPANAYASVITIAGTGSSGKVNGKGTAASFSDADGMVMDNSGNIYVTDIYNCVIRKIAPDGTVSVYAGNGTQGFKDGTTATAEFNFPTGLAIDPSGNIYVADYNNNAIRKITPAGAVTTFAGGTAGYADGLGPSASFFEPYSLVSDASGNIYIADEGNGDIRKITPAGVVTTFAGNGTEIAADGTGTAAGFSLPISIAIGPQGNFYVVDNSSGSTGIRMITPAGVVTTLAGGGVSGYIDGQGSVARFNNPIGIATDALGNVYVGDADNMIIRKITPGGLVSTIAGTPTPGDKDGIGAGASFNQPFGLLSDNNGNLYVSDFLNYQVRKILLTGYAINKTLPTGLTFDPTTGIISGTPTVSSPATDYTITAYNLGGSSSFIVNITVKAAKVPLPAPPNISYQTPQVYTVNVGISPLSPTNTGGAVPATIYGQVTTFAGNGSQGSLDGTGTSASFNHPTRLGEDAATGNLYVADRDNNLIRKVTPTADVSTFANGFDQPNGVIVDPKGNLFVADAASNTIKEVSPSGTVSTYAGSGLGGSTDGAGTAASFNSPYNLTRDVAGNIYVADSGNGSVRKITTAAAVSTFASGFNNFDGIATDVSGNVYVGENNTIRKISPAGAGTNIAGNANPGASNGPAASATFRSPNGIAFDAIGNMYIADIGNNMIRKLDAAGNVTTLAGSGAAGALDGTGASATFNLPNDVQSDPNGYLYVTDYGNSLIRKVIVTGYAIDKALPPGLTFDATTGTVSGTPTTTWPSTNYTITAYNTGGSSATVLNITVNEITVVKPPAITYQTPQVYYTNTAIAALAPTNTGGSVPANTYGEVSTLAGSGNAGKADGTGASASFTYLGNPVVNNNGNIYVPDAGGNDLIRKVTPAGVVTTLTSSSISPTGIAIDAAGNLYVTEFANNIINKITPAGVQTTFAGSGNSGNQDGTGAAASFFEPRGITIDKSGNLYVADSGNGLIRKISPAGVVTTVTNGIESPADIAIDSKGNFFISADSRALIYKMDANANVSVFAGSGNDALVDGTGTAASFYTPYGLAIDATDNIYVGDYGNRVIRKITPAAVVTTFAGTGKSGAVNGDPKVATFEQPTGVALDNAGNLYVADNVNYMLRKISLTGYTIDKTLPPGLSFNSATGIISGTPTATSPNTAYTITAYNSGGSSSALVNIEVTTQVALAAISTKTTCSTDFMPVVSGGSGVYTFTSSNTATATIVAGKIHIVAPGTSTITAGDGTTSASTLLTVNGPITPTVSITPGEYSACVGQSLTYTATPVNGGINPIYQWQVNGIDAGTNSATFTSSTLQTNDIITCTLTDTSDCTTGPAISNKASLIADAYVTPAISIQASVTGPVAPGTAITFTATATNGGTSPSYQWAINGTNTGTNSPTFTYSCFADGDMVTCTLTNQGGKCLTALSAQSNTIAVNVNNTVSLTISASANNVYANTPVTFTATVANAANISSYQWMVNGKSAGSNSATFTTSTLYNGDVVTCAVITGSGCNLPVNSNAIQMIILPPLAIIIPNTFTPNGDGINDLWDITNLNYYRNCTVTIFTRYGTQVFYSKGYAKPWDGTYNGSKLASGTYYYIIDLANNTPKLSGYIAIVR